MNLFKSFKEKYLNLTKKAAEEKSRYVIEVANLRLEKIRVESLLARINKSTVLPNQTVRGRRFEKVFIKFDIVSLGELLRTEQNKKEFLRWLDEELFNTFLKK